MSRTTAIRLFGLGAVLLLFKYIVAALVFLNALLGCATSGDSYSTAWSEATYLSFVVHECTGEWMDNVAQVAGAEYQQSKDFQNWYYGETEKLFPPGIFLG
jgi:hypothetical protein